MTPKSKTLFLSLFLILGLLSFSQTTHAATVTKTIYSWVKDIAGNISTSLNDTVDITIPDAPANTYYISSSTGNDTNNGTSSSTPWKTIAKVNSQTFTPGASILFKSGDTWTGETIIVNSSGNSTSPITYSSYGTGAQPIISGFTTITGWATEGNGIYSKTISPQSAPNMVTVDGVNTGMGRWPNSGWLTYESFNSTVSITDNQLTASPSWTGAEIVIRKNPYVLDRNIVTNHATTLLEFTSLGTTTTANNGWGYFFQNSLQTLDQFGEWYYGSGKIYVYFGANNPNNYVVKISTVDKLLYAASKNYITFDGIDFVGSNKYAIHLSSSNYANVKNCNIEYSGESGIYATTSNSIISNCAVNHVNQTGISIVGTFNQVLNNIIKNCGLIVGSSLRGNEAIGIYAEGADDLYQYNSIDSVGYNGIYLVVAKRSIVRNNLIDHFCLNLNDCGGIYTAGNGTTSYPGGISDRVIDGNIVLNGIGNLLGTTTTIKIVEGIYVDEPTMDIDVTNNTLAFNAYSGLKLHNANNIRVLNNTFFGNLVSALRLQESNASTPLRNDDFHANKFIAKNNTELAVKHISITDDITLLGSLDNNYYARPIDDNLIIQTGTPTDGTVNRTLASWKTFSSQDTNSQKSPVTITDPNDILFEYNATTSNKVVSLGSNTYVDITGATKTGSITLLPYTSIILIKTN